MPNTALILGATGLVGRALSGRLAADAAWRGFGMARRVVPGSTPLPCLSADLLDTRSIATHAAALATITHVFVAMRIPAADAASETRDNTAALENVIRALESAGADLKHVCLVHGTKWYGCHLGPYRIPAREDDPRHPAMHFYSSQHDLIREMAKGKRWTWSTLRPHTVWGYSPGTGNSLVNAVGVYAALAREAGEPLHFPGPAATYTKQSQGCTAGLLSEAMVWASTTARCAGQDFNLTNGDTFRWAELWPAIAAAFGLAVGRIDPDALSIMAERGPGLWANLVRRHGLREADLSRLVSWRYLQGLLAMTWDDESSLSKLRDFGFQGRAASIEAFLASLRNMQSDRILPK